MDRETKICSTSDSNIILEELWKLINQQQIINNHLSASILKGKYSEQWKALKDSIDNLLRSYFFCDMDREVPVNKLDAYFEFLAKLIEETRSNYMQVMKYLPEKMCKEALGKFRDVMMDREEAYCMQLRCDAFLGVRYVLDAVEEETKFG